MYHAAILKIESFFNRPRIKKIREGFALRCRYRPLHMIFYIGLALSAPAYIADLITFAAVYITGSACSFALPWFDHVTAYAIAAVVVVISREDTIWQDVLNRRAE